jgi:Cu/Zn superoxide dismutase
MSALRFGLAIALLASGAACAQATAKATNTAVVHQAASPSATTAATPAATPTPMQMPVQAPQPPPAAPAAPAAAPPQPAVSTFALAGAGSGSVRVTSANGVTTITVSAAGLAAGAHATHVHRGCDGSTMAHLFSINSVVGPAGSSTTTFPGGKAPGWTVIIYPGPSPVGRPVLCATIS